MKQKKNEISTIFFLLVLINIAWSGFVVLWDRMSSKFACYFFPSNLLTLLILKIDKHFFDLNWQTKKKNTRFYFDFVNWLEICLAFFLLFKGNPFEANANSCEITYIIHNSKTIVDKRWHLSEKETWKAFSKKKKRKNWKKNELKWKWYHIILIITMLQS